MILKHPSNYSPKIPFFDATSIRSRIEFAAGIEILFPNSAWITAGSNYLLDTVIPLLNGSEYQFRGIGRTISYIE